MPETSETQTRVNEASGTITTATKSETKPGWKTTEFYFSAIAAAISLLYATGLIAPEGTSRSERVVAFLAAALASWGYSTARGNTKAAGK